MVESVDSHSAALAAHETRVALIEVELLEGASAVSRGLG